MSDIIEVPLETIESWIDTLDAQEYDLNHKIWAKSYMEKFLKEYKQKQMTTITKKSAKPTSKKVVTKKVAKVKTKVPSKKAVARQSRKRG